MRGYVAEPIDAGGLVGGIGVERLEHEFNSSSQLSCYLVTVSELCSRFTEMILLNVPYQARGQRAPTQHLA